MGPARILITLAALLLPAGVAPEGKFVPSPLGFGEGLVIPASSPVTFQRLDKDGAGHFSGRFVLSGTFTYGCEIECTPPLKDEQLVLAIVPDPALAARLPHWKVRDSDIKIFITHEAPLTRAIADQADQAGLRSGKIPGLRGHVSVVVDDFRAAIECDSASYSARFVSIAKPPEHNKVKLAGDFGCG